MKKLKLKAFWFAILVSNITYAAPPVKTPSGVHCDLGCPIFVCGQVICIVCNAEGCVTMPV